MPMPKVVPLHRRSPAPAPVMETRGLTFAAGGRRLIDGVDLTLGEGRRTVILGANGAGKSVLLRLLHGLLKPLGGDILWRGQPLSPATRRQQAMVFQRPVLLRRSVAANLKFALSSRGIRGDERKARTESALAEARLDHLAHRPARLLSGGEQQRLALARALACDPQVLFLDEPTASLDPASTAAVERLLDTAHAQGITTVLVTHDPGQARRMGDDLIFMHDGRIAESGPLPDTLADPQSEELTAWTEGRLLLNPKGRP